LSESDARAARLELERLLPPNAWDLPTGFADAAERYVALLLDANRRLNLTRVVEPAAVARLHLLDALAALPLVDVIAPRRALDLGSGGGVPGLVLALARPTISWTLVDSVGKKADALRGFAHALGLRNVAVLAERAETLGRDAEHRERHDLVTARACAALPVLVEYGLPLLRVNGSLLAWKGRLTAQELAGGSAAAAELGGSPPDVRPAGLEALGDHRFVLVRKQHPTPSRYPRRPGEPARRPLG
jgi:16S rRNA (guanine527-N7)-methyltransferase